MRHSCEQSQAKEEVLGNKDHGGGWVGDGEKEARCAGWASSLQSQTVGPYNQTGQPWQPWWRGQPRPYHSVSVKLSDRISARRRIME